MASKSHPTPERIMSLLSETMRGGSALFKSVYRSKLVSINGAELRDPANF
jgi:hypothetical protein